MAQFFGFFLTVAGVFGPILGILWGCVKISRDMQSRRRAAISPTSIEAIVVQIGKLVDTYLIAHPLWKSNRDTTRQPSILDPDNRNIIVHLHKHFNIAESVPIRNGFVITIDSSHKLNPLLRLVGKSVFPIPIVPMSLITIAGGLSIL